MHRRPHFWVLIGTVILALLLIASPRLKHEPRPPVPDVPPLSATLRQTLAPAMKRHARAMQALTDAVTRLDNPRVATLARAMLDERDLAQPLSANADVPREFRALEEAFAQRTRDLADAAAAGDDDAVAARHSDLAVTCARCHEAFR